MAGNRAYGNPEIRTFSVDELIEELETEVRDAESSDLEATANFFRGVIDYIKAAEAASRESKS